MARRITPKEMAEDKAKVSLTGLTIIMMGTLFIYFLWAVINSKFLVNFSIDSLVGVVAFVILVRNLKLKYDIIKKYTSEKQFMILDFVAFVLCFLIKVVVQIPFDFSLIILLLSHYATKQIFNKIIEKKWCSNEHHFLFWNLILYFLYGIFDIIYNFILRNIIAFFKYRCCTTTFFFFFKTQFINSVFWDYIIQFFFQISLRNLIF